MSKRVFHVRASYYDKTALIVRQPTRLGLKKIAVFRQNDSFAVGFGPGKHAGSGFGELTVLTEDGKVRR